MWLFYCLLIITTASGAFTSMHLFVPFPDRLPKTGMALVFIAANMVLAAIVAYVNISFQLNTINPNWFIILFSIFYIWLWNKEVTDSRHIRLQQILFIISLLIVWISWLMVTAGKPNRHLIFASLITGITTSFVLFFIPRIQQRKHQTGYTLAVIQCAIALYYLFEARWSETFVTGKSVSEDVSSTLTQVPGGTAALVIAIIFLAGIFSNQFKNNKS